MKYYYIIMRDGFMHEIPFNEESYKGAFVQWRNKGIIMHKPKGKQVPIGINTLDISQILDQTTYESYVRNQKPKEYIRDGVWYDGKEHAVIRREEWKELELKQRLKLADKKQEAVEMSSPEKTKKLKEIREKLNKTLNLKK